MVADFRTVQEAIDAVPLCNKSRVVIQVSPGIYKQPVYIPKTKNLITLAGFRPEDTLLTWNNTATKIEHHQASRVIGTGTFGCGRDTEKEITTEGDSLLHQEPPKDVQDGEPEITIEGASFVHGEPRGPPVVDSELEVLHEKVTK